jgi:hypothetical protein
MPPLQKILQGILHTEDERKRTIKPQERKEKGSESITDSAAHNETLKQQKQLNDRNYHIPININTKYQRTQLPYQRTPFGKLD